MPFQTGGAGVTTLSDLQIDVDKDWKAHNVYNFGDLIPKVDGAYNIGSPTAGFDTVYAKAGPPPGADTVGKKELKKPAVDTSYLYDGSVNIVKVSGIPISEGSLTGVKGFTYQISEKKDFLSKTETPNHTYWHRIYETPAAFSIVEQKYGTELTVFPIQRTTPSKSAPNTADPNPQPGACWSVSMLPDGTQVGGFAALSPTNTGLTWDGTYLWITGLDADYVYQVKTDGTQVGGFASPPNPYGIAWDGEYLWTTSNTAAFIYQLKDDGTQTGNGFASLGPNPAGLGWDGTYLWNADPDADYIYQLDTTGTKVGGFASFTTHPHGVVWDGAYLWHSDFDADYIYQLLTDGTQVGGFATPTTYPYGLAWDGAYLWNVDGSIGYVYQFGNAGNFDVNYRIFAK